MTKLVLGIDPDSDKYGVAEYELVKDRFYLQALNSMNIVDMNIHFENITKQYNPENVHCVIEDVKANTFQYGRTMPVFKNKTHDQCIRLAFKLGQGPGKCMHSQTVAEQFIKYYGFNLIQQSPVKGNWAKNKAQFERVTGWNSRSNEDNRSAAFVAFLHLENIKRGEYG